MDRMPVDYAKASKPRPVFNISGYKLATLVLPLPIIGFVACVALSIIYDYDRSTATHCRVANYLPSISSAIGGFTPQRYIWRVCIALHCAPRYMISFMYFNYYSYLVVRNYDGLYRLLVKFNCAINIAELSCLVLLTCVSSTENYGVHENSFIAFMVFSELHMLITILLFYWANSSVSSIGERERKSLRLKILFCTMNLAICAVASYFFYRHNKYCEPGVYTYFAACEYMIVLTNIAFHGTAIVEFGDGRLTFTEAPSNKSKPS